MTMLNYAECSQRLADIFGLVRTVGSVDGPALATALARGLGVTDDVAERLVADSRQFLLCVVPYLEEMLITRPDLEGKDRHLAGQIAHEMVAETSLDRLIGASVQLRWIKVSPPVTLSSLDDIPSTVEGTVEFHLANALRRMLRHWCAVDVWSRPENKRPRYAHSRHRRSRGRPRMSAKPCVATTTSDTTTRPRSRLPW